MNLRYARRRVREADRERGAITGMVVILYAGLIVLLALVVDGNRLMTARREAEDVAVQAARAGVQSVSEADLATNHTIRIDAGDATARAASIAARYPGFTITVAVVDDQVTVTARHQVSLPMLGLVGVGSRTVRGIGRARAAAGRVVAE